MSTLFKKPDGSYVYVDDKFASAALERGYQPATDEQFQASKQTGQAFAEGAARGLTLGFGDKLTAAVESGWSGTPENEVLDQMRLRKQENPKAALGGEIAGGLGMAVATGGGPSALLGNGVKGAAFEGGLAGLGTVVSESTLDRTPLTLEKMTAGMAAGALTGAGIAKGMQIVGKGVSAGMKKLGGSTLGDTLAGLADDAEWRSYGQSNKRWMDRNAPFKDDILAMGRKLGVNALNDESLSKVAQHVDEVGAKIGASIDDLERQVPLKGNDALRSKLVSFIEDGLDAEYAGRPVFTEAVAGAKKMTQQILEDPEQTWKKVWKFQTDLFEPALKGTKAADVRETMRQLVRDFVFDDAASGIVNGSGASMRALGKEFRTASVLKDALEKRTESLDAAGGPMGMASVRNLFGAAVGGSVGGIPGALAGGLIENQVQRRGGFVLSSVLRKLGSSKALSGVANGLSARVQQVLMTAPGALGAFRIPFEQAMARGAGAVLETYLQASRTEEGASIGPILGLEPETSAADVEGVGRRLAALDALQSAGDGIDERIDTGIDAVLGSKPGPAVPFKVPSTADFLKHVDGISAQLRDPTLAFESIPGDIAGAAPATAAMLVNNLLKSAAFLDSKAPKNPYAALPESMRPMWKPSDADVARWYRYVEAIQEPSKMLEKMAQGTFTLEHKEALQNVYPEMFADIRARMFERLASWDRPLNYSKKTMLAQFFGPEILGLKPGALGVLQASFQPKPSDAPPSKGGTRPDGRQVVDPDKNALTQGQRMEAR